MESPRCLWQLPARRGMNPPQQFTGLKRTATKAILCQSWLSWAFTPLHGVLKNVFKDSVRVWLEWMEGKRSKLG